MKFIKLTHKNGSDVYVNPDNILLVTTSPRSGRTVIFLSDKESYAEVDESCEQVIELMEAE